MACHAPGWRPWLASACLALPPGAVGLSGQTPNFGFRIPDFKIENSVFESGVSSPVPGHARIRMRISVCAYPGARAGEGESRCALGSSLDWGLQRLAGSGVRRLLYGLLQSGPRRTAARPVPWRNGRFCPGPSGQGRERKRAQTVWRGGISPWPRPPNPNPAWPSSSRRGSARCQRISRHVCRKFWPKRLGMVRRSGPGLPCPIGSSLAQSHCAPGANGPGLPHFGFRLWRMAPGAAAFAVPSSLSLPLPLAQAHLGVQVPRCPGAQAQATMASRGETPRTRLESGWDPDLAPPAQAHWLHLARSPSGSALAAGLRQLRLRKSRGAPLAPRPPGGLYGGALKAHPSSSAQALQGPIPSAHTAGPIGGPIRAL